MAPKTVPLGTVLKHPSGNDPRNVSSPPEGCPFFSCPVPKSTFGVAPGAPSPPPRSRGGTRRGLCTWGALKASVPPQGSRGELLLSLCYNPSANSIVVNIIKARNLKAMDIGGTSGTTPAPTLGGGARPCPHTRPGLSTALCPPADPYVKVWLMYKDKRVEKKKTVVMKRCLNPVFNESFSFDIPTERLRETTIVITVMDKDRLSRNDVIGKVGPAPKKSRGWMAGGTGRDAACPRRSTCPGRVAPAR